MQNLDTIHDYLRTHSDEIGNRILASYPALFRTDETPSPLLSQMLRTPYPAQTLAIVGVSKRRNALLPTSYFLGALGAKPKLRILDFGDAQVDPGQLSLF